MPLQIPTTQTGLEASIEAAAKKAGRNLKINLGTSAKSIEGLSQPLGRITGKADQFTKSMEAANARVLAFGASVGVLSAVTRGFKELISTTVEVEKSLASINSILGATGGQLESFKKTIFSVARETEQSFATVSQAALELSRQGLKTEEVISRLNDAMILSRLSGLQASEAVFGLTAAVNSFNKAGITSAEVLNKLSAAAVSAAVSERDLIEGIKRSGSVAIQAGVSFDELVGVISAVQQKTARGGAVIGNSFKTIFTRIQSLDKLQTMQNLGVQVTDTAGEVLSGTKLIQNLGKAISALPDAKQLQIAEKLVGKFQIAPFLAILDDYNSKTSTAIKVTEVAAGATNEAYNRNVALNKTLSAAINEATVNLKELANTLGEIGVTDSLKNILGFFNSLVTNIKDLMEGEGLGSDFARGIVKGISNVLSGPGLAIFAAIIAKLTIDLVRFGTASISTFFGLNKAAQQIAATQGQIASTLLGNKGIQDQILAIENSTLTTEQKRLAQTKFFTTALNEQLAVMTRMQSIAGRIAPGVIAGTKGGTARRAAGGFIPNFDAVRGYGAKKMIPNFDAVRGYGAERRDIARGVGGAPASARPVAIPNFNFGGGKRGTMIANNSEVVVPNYAGGGSAVFNRDMIGAMGMPSGARNVAAGGYIPNFSVFGATKATSAFTLKQAIDSKNFTRPQLTSGFGKKAVDKELGAVSVGGKPVAAQQGTIYDANLGNKASVMLIPQVMRLDHDMIQHKFKTPYKGYSMFRGAVSGIDPDLKRNKKSETGELHRLTRLDAELDQALSTALNGVLAALFPDVKSRPKSPLSSRQTKNLMKKQEGGPGAFGAMRGALFEAIISSVIGGSASDGAGTLDVRFDNNKAQLDLIFGLGKKSPIQYAFGDYKNSTGQIGKYVRQVIDNLGTGGRIIGAGGRARGMAGTKAGGQAASGYIPSFASNPLMAAIGRERSAGLPINQIRINQDGGLRNAANPQGLAVTNMRDEPTGAIPSFAKSASPAQVEAGFGGLMMKLLVLQSGFMMLSGVLGEVTNENKAVAATLKLLNVALAASMIVPALGGIKGISGFLSGGMGRDMMRQSAVKSALGNMTQMNIAGTMVPVKNTASLKGMAKLGNAAKGAAGGLLALAGPLAAAAAVAGVAFLAYKHLGSSAGNLEKAQKTLAEVTKRTAEEIGKLRLPEWMTKSRETDIEDGVKAVVAATGIEAEGKQQRGGGLTGPITGVGDADLIKSFKEQVEKTLKSGVALPAVLKAIEAPLARSGKKDSSVLGAFGNQIQQADFMKMIANVADLEGRTNLPQSVVKMLEDISPNQQAAFGRVKEAQDKLFRLGGSPESEKAFAEFDPAMAAERERLRAQVRAAGVPEDLDFETVFQQALSVSGPGGQQKMARTQQMRASLVKAQVKNEIELAKIRNQGIDDLEKDVAFATSRKSLTESELLGLKEKIALRDKDRQTSAKIGDILIKNVDTIEKLTLSQKQEAMLLEKVAGLDMDALASDEKREAVLKSIATVTGMTKDQAKLFLENADSAVIALQKQGEADKKNLRLKTSLNQKTAEFNRLLKEGVKLSNLQAGRTAFETTRGDEAQRIRLRARIDDINRNPKLTPEQKATQAEQFITQLEELDIKEADAKALQAFTEALNQLALDVPLLQGAIKGSRERVAAAISQGADVATATATERDTLQGIIDEDQGRFGLFGNLGPLTEQGNKVGKFFLNIDKANQALVDNKAKIDAGTAARGKENELLGRFDRLSDHLRNFANTLEEVDEKLKFDFLFARSGTDMISQIRNRREKQAMAGVKGDAAGTAGVTRRFALEEFDQQMRLAPTRAERRNLERQRPFLEQAFDVQKKIAELSKDQVKNADELKAAQEELLQIEEKRLQANETIAAKLENAFVFSQRDIRNQLGDNLVSAAKNFSDRMADGLVNAIAKGEDLGETLKMAARDFLLDMAKANMKAAFMNISSGIFGGGKASGGIITGGSGKRDDVPTMLMGGEFVVNKRAVQKYGPNFLNALNMGAIQGMARGGFFTPGTYGQGAITGKSDLLSFATQPYTTGQFDKISGGRGFASVDLEPQSGRLTMWGRKNSPRFQREQASKREAFGLYTQQVGRETRMKEQEEENKKSLSGAFKAALITGALSWAMGGSGLGSLFSGGGYSSQVGAAYGGTANMTVAGSMADRSFANTGHGLFATGGAVPYAAGVDSVPSMLSGGEFVMNAAATQRIGRGTLNALNGGAGGRGDEEIVGKLDELIEVSEGAERGESVINITVNSDGTETEEGGTKAADTQKTLAVRIRDVVKQVIDEEKRLGGSLRQAKG